MNFYRGREVKWDKDEREGSWSDQLSMIQGNCMDSLLEVLQRNISNECK
jgi:hypothetical protein